MAQPLRLSRPVPFPRPDLSFGTRLRLQRERQQIAIAEIATATKINPSLLKALERDDVSRWPQGIFRRSYIREYASAIGLDPDVVMREFLELYPDSVGVLPAGAVMWPEASGEPEIAPPANRLGRMVSSAFATVPAMLRRPQKPPPATETAAAPPPPVAEAAAAAAAAPPPPQPLPDLNLSAAALLCTRLGRTLDPRDVPPLLAEAARVLGAVGVIVWLSDARATKLRPSLRHGYPDAVLARLTDVPIDAANAVAAAFRSADVCVVDGDGQSGAVVVPLLGPRGCLGVMALELLQGGERRESVCALATIVAAQLAALLAAAPLTHPVTA
jgi:transcriptional regulator with XRE-family HTH domain